MKKANRWPFLVCAFALLVIGVPGEIWAQGSFTPVKPATVAGYQFAPGYVLTPGGSSTLYFNGLTWTLSGPGTGSGYDAVTLYRTNPNVYNIPPGWGWTQGSMGHCAPQFGPGTHDDYAWVLLYVLVPGGVAWSAGQCNGTANPAFDPFYLELTHSMGGANPPVFQPDLPEEAAPPCTNSCGGTP